MKYLYYVALIAAFAFSSCNKSEISHSGDEQNSETASLKDPKLGWSDSSYDAILGGINKFPELTNKYGVSVSYSSSSTAVATVDASTGSITLLSEGTTVITANSSASDSFNAGTASYTLNVKSGSDDNTGGGSSVTFPTSGDRSSDDDISNTVFSCVVTVTYSSSGASVAGYSPLSDDIKISVSGNQVTITYDGLQNVAYKLTGTASDGFFKLYSTRKQALWLSDLNLTNSKGAALNNQSGKRTFVYVDGTNRLSDGSSAPYSTTDNEDMKSVFFSEGQLVFSGSGSLYVTASNGKEKSAIASDDYVRVMDSPSIILSVSSGGGHGIRGKDYVRLSGGTTDITAKAAMKKGISSEGHVLVEGGSHSIAVSGGVARDAEDNEYKGTAGIKADNYFGMTGGTVTIRNTGSGGKGVRAGSSDYAGALSDSYISGGTLDISTSGSETSGVSSKGIKIGWATKSGRSVTANVGNLNISGGTVTVSSAKSEGIEAKGNIVISGGQTYVTSNGDDAINSQGEFDVTGGYVYAYSSANDAMDANHDLKISGGYVYAMTTRGAPELALDANTEERYKLYITGGVIVAYGGLENGYSASQKVYSFSASANAWNALHDGNSYIAAFKAPSNISTFIVSAPTVSRGYKGVSVGGTAYANGTMASSDISGGTSVSLSTYSGGGGGPGGGGGGRPW